MPRLNRTSSCFALLLACGLGVAAADEVAEVRELLVRGQAAQALERAERAEGSEARAGSLAAQQREPQMRFLRGVALMDLQRNTEALALFEAMAQGFPELPDPWNNIALLHVRANRLEPARLALETALRNDPSYRTARANLGLVYLMLAVQAWEHAAAAGPADPMLVKRLELARSLLSSTAR